MHKTKPDLAEAMQQLLVDIRAALPFDQPRQSLCQHTCIGCPKKLMDYLEEVLEEKETALAIGERPSFGDIERLARLSKKIHRSLHKNGLLSQPQPVK